MWFPRFRRARAFPRGQPPGQGKRLWGGGRSLALVSKYTSNATRRPPGERTLAAQGLLHDALKGPFPAMRPAQGAVRGSDNRRTMAVHHATAFCDPGQGPEQRGEPEVRADPPVRNYWRLGGTRNADSAQSLCVTLWGDPTTGIYLTRKVKFVIDYIYVGPNQASP